MLKTRKDFDAKEKMKAQATAAAAARKDVSSATTIPPTAEIPKN